MKVDTKREADIEKRSVFLDIPFYDLLLIPADRFSEMSNLITENGGRVADLDDPKLTHVVLDKRDISRRKELIARTSE